MPVDLIVNNNNFAYPSDGDEPGWGADATGWAVEVTNLLGTLEGSNDIAITSVAVNNNISSPTDVNGLVFNAGTVRSARIEYSIYRVTGINELAEKGSIELVFKNGGTIGSKWSLEREFVGDDAGIAFTMTDAGQMQYTSTNVTGTGYSGLLNFYAKVTLQ